MGPEIEVVWLSARPPTMHRDKVAVSARLPQVPPVNAADYRTPSGIDREFVTSAKKSRILTNFPKLKKIVKKSLNARV